MDCSNFGEGQDQAWLVGWLHNRFLDWVDKRCSFFSSRFSVGTGGSAPGKVLANLGRGLGLVGLVDILDSFLYSDKLSNACWPQGWQETAIPPASVDATLAFMRQRKHDLPDGRFQRQQNVAQVWPQRSAAGWLWGRPHNGETLHSFTFLGFTIVIRRQSPDAGIRL